MKEYGIYRINNGARPFMLDIYNDLDLAKLRINELVCNWEEKRLNYYIDNEYFDNKFKFISYKGIFYCQIQCREVSCWKSLDDEKSSKNSNNIIFLQNYKKTLTK